MLSICYGNSEIFKFMAILLGGIHANRGVSGLEKAMCVGDDSGFWCFYIQGRSQ